MIEGNCKSKIAARQWGVNFCHLDVSRGRLGFRTTDLLVTWREGITIPFEQKIKQTERNSGGN